MRSWGAASPCMTIWSRTLGSLQGPSSPHFINMQYSSLVTLADASEHASILHLSYSNRCCSIVWLWFLRVEIESTSYQHFRKENSCQIFSPSDLRGVETLEFRNCWQLLNVLYLWKSYIFHIHQKLKSDAAYKFNNILNEDSAIRSVRNK